MIISTWWHKIFQRYTHALEVVGGLLVGGIALTFCFQRLTHHVQLAPPALYAEPFTLLVASIWPLWYITCAATLVACGAILDALWGWQWTRTLLSGGALLLGAGSVYVLYGLFDWLVRFRYMTGYWEVYPTRSYLMIVVLTVLAALVVIAARKR